MTTENGPRIPRALINKVASLIGVKNNSNNRHFIRYGLKSGFKVCCIAFFVTVWQRVTPPDAPEGSALDNAWLDLPVSDAWTDYFKWRHRLSERYGACVPCPACMLHYLTEKYTNMTTKEVYDFYADPAVATAIQAYNKAGDIAWQKAVDEGRCKNINIDWDGK